MLVAGGWSGGDRHRLCLYSYAARSCVVGAVENGTGLTGSVSSFSLPFILMWNWCVQLLTC